jgi:hypothetical protein
MSRVASTPAELEDVGLFRACIRFSKIKELITTAAPVRDHATRSAVLLVNVTMTSIRSGHHRHSREDLSARSAYRNGARSNPRSDPEETMTTAPTACGRQKEAGGATPGSSA